MATTGRGDPRRDIPSIPDSAGPLKGPLDAIREAVQTYMGNRGNPLDMGVTWRQLVEQGFARLDSFRGTGGGGPGAVRPGAYVPIASEVEPDLSPPPTPTGFSGTSGFSTIFLDWDAPAYTQGHGHGQTNIYGVLYPTGAPAPVFADASLVSVVAGLTTIFNFSTTLGTRWAFWIKFQTADGVESASPAGGLNGVQVTTGVVGNSDLGPLVITADKISAGTYEGINLVRNAGAEDGITSWALVHTSGTSAVLTSDTSDKTGGSRSFRITKASGSNGAGYGCLAFPVIPGETYSVRLRLRGSSASAAGLFLRAHQRATYPPGGYCTDANDDSVAEIGGVANAPIATTWTGYQYTYLVPAGVYWISFAVYNWTASTALDMWFDDVIFGRQISASTIAAGSIAVGRAAIADGAIRNALIENAAVDNAKIANLSAAKLTVGDGTIGGNLKSTTFTPGSAGWIVRPDGTAEFAFVHIRGTIAAGQIAAGSINADRITAGTITTDRLVANAATVAANGAQSLTDYIITATSGVNSGVVNLFSLTSTGQAVTIGGVFNIEAYLDQLSVERIVITIALYIDGSIVTATSQTQELSPCTNSTIRRINTACPIAFRSVSVAAGNHTYGVLMTASFVNSSGAAVNGNGYMRAQGTLHAQENKV